MADCAPAVGKMVHYRQGGDCVPAIVLAVKSAEVTLSAPVCDVVLHVFPFIGADGRVWSVPLDPTGEAEGSWHWPVDVA